EAPLKFDRSRSTFVVTPDGLHIVFSATSGGRVQAFVRSIGQEGVRPLDGTQDVEALFISGDGKSVGPRTTDGQGKRVSIDGGQARSITNAPGISTPAWSTKDLVVLSRGFGNPLVGVPASGGEPKQLTTLDSGQLGHGSPAFLPDGDAVVFTVFTGAGAGLA